MAFIAHIGAGKTGSSAIQSFIRNNVTTLLDSGFVVPTNKLDFSSGELTGDQVFAFESLRGDEARTLKSLEDLRAAAGGRTVLISAENLSNLGGHRAFKRAAARYPFRVILYIRRQDDLLVSAWQQWYSKIGREFDDWLPEGLEMFGRWDRLLDDWTDTVGRSQISVRLFERSGFAGGDISIDFAEEIGLNVPASALKLPGDVNPSFSEIIVPLVAGNPLIFKGAHDNSLYDLLAKLVPDYSRGKRVSLISRESRDLILSHYAECNEIVRQRYFPERDSLFAPVDHSKYNYLSGDALREEQMRFLTSVVFRNLLQSWASEPAVKADT